MEKFHIDSTYNRAGRLSRFIPALRWVHEYQTSWLSADLAAGITLGALMVPVGLAFGELAGVPMAGLYAGMLPLIAYAIFGSSRQLIVGPDATMAAFVAVSVAPLAGGDAGRLAVLASLLAILVGLACILGSFLRLGFVADLLAKPVVAGFMLGLAAVIAVGQLPKVLGVPGGGETTRGSVPGGLPKRVRDQFHQLGDRRFLCRHHPVLSPVVPPDTWTDRGLGRFHSRRLLPQAGPIRRRRGWRHPAGTAWAPDPYPECAGCTSPSASGPCCSLACLLRYRGYGKRVCLAQSLSYRHQSGNAGPGNGEHLSRPDPEPANFGQRLPHGGR